MAFLQNESMMFSQAYLTCALGSKRQRRSNQVLLKLFAKFVERFRGHAEELYRQPAGRDYFSPLYVSHIQQLPEQSGFHIIARNTAKRRHAMSANMEFILENNNNNNNNNNVFCYGFIS
jgi:hypothetical protein